MNNRLIVSRHPAAVEFIRASCPDFQNAPVIESATADDVRGKIVAGNPPLHLACLANKVYAVEFDGPPPRGAEYGLAEMRAAGARLARYRVERLPEPAMAQQGAIVHTLTLSGGEPRLKTEQCESVTLGEGRNDRHNKTVTVRLTPGRTYLLIRDARYKGRGPGRVIADAARDACGKCLESAYSGHPDHAGDWAIYAVPDGGIDVTAGTSPPRRLAIAGMVATLEELPVSI